MNRKPYPSDVSDNEWAFVAPYVTLMTEDAPQREHSLRELLRVAQSRNPQPSAAIFDSRTMQSTPESGWRAGFDPAKSRRGSKVHLAVDTLGYLLALLVTPANEQERQQVAQLTEQIQQVTGASVQIAFVDQ